MGLHPDFACKCVDKTELANLKQEKMRVDQSKGKSAPSCAVVDTCAPGLKWDDTICQCVAVAKEPCNEPTEAWGRCNLAQIWSAKKCEC